MKTTLKLEELAMLLLATWAFGLQDLSWWWFIGLFFVPDVGMLGYLFNNKWGAFFYNIFHHKGLAIVIGLTGYYPKLQELEVAGIILFAHSSFDRLLGYGLKFEKGFKFTHLGEIGK
ncbi:uncharacterized protein DUF4260 [Christiangramia gaetbulicola]|uniref:Uncharacterized protein DUF4260 n=1 Tax=Christiangramia gaetbulicola TaxID=703340 RepID=A0A2T6ALE3_9FLAO|nr:DUF4260 domain-containing protein [Christiangramia gaetbulicola]PTX44597.1 uncharacterized protein DUF4260 [Christiangramia gaetbulicola]